MTGIQPLEKIMQRSKIVNRLAVVIALVALQFSASTALAARFTADLVVTGPGDDYIYKLHVKDNLYRLQKVKGPMNVPPYPTIVNKDTGITWGLNDQMHQYMEMRDMEKTGMMNPLVGWTMTRKGMIEKPGPIETVNGYDCETHLYTEAGKSEITAKVWISKKLGHLIREERFGTNQNPVMELRDIQEGPVDSALFEIPEGYTRMDMGGGPATKPAGPAEKKVSTASAETPAATNTAPVPTSSGNLMFILDASGSMWGQVEGKAKIVIAKEVLTGLVRDLPDDTVVGLVAYGHRRKGDCDDVEELVPMAPVNREKIIQTIQGLSPKGKTPISRSVRMTAERIRHLEDETTIILVSDGKETCDPDPCGLVKELKEAGIRFVMHVIGFDVTEEEKAQLECMARAGGGEYYTADNAADFQLAAKAVVKKSQKPYGVLRVTVMKNGNPFLTPLRVLRTEGGERVLDSSSGKTGVQDIRLAPGIYDLEVKDLNVGGGKTPVVRLTDITIVAGETVERAADFSDGTLSITALRNDSPCKVTVFYYRQGEKRAFISLQTQAKSGNISRKLLPGVYRIEVVDNSIVGRPSVVFDALEIPPGQTVEKTAEFSSGQLTIKAALNGEPISIPLEIYKPEGDKVFKNWTNFPKGTRIVNLPAGTYTVKVRRTTDNNTKLFENVVIEEGRAQTITAAFHYGQLTIIATLNGEPFATPFEIYDASEKKVFKNWTNSNVKGQWTVLLLAGTYKVKVLSIKDKNQVVMFDAVQVINGREETVTATFPVAP